MKLYSPLLVVLLMADACWSQCRNANWLVSFEKKGWSTCGSSIEYITGFYRDKKTPNEPISLVEEARCCKAPLPIQNQPSTCVDADWWTVLDSNHRWALCPDGYFLQGLYRTEGHLIYNIEEGRCCKPNSLPNSYQRCYDHDVSLTFDDKGWSSCYDGFYLTGIYRGGCETLNCIEKFRCCKLSVDVCRIV